MSVCAPGGEKATPPNLDDLELKAEEERERYLPMRIVKSGTRDGAVLDGVVAVSLPLFLSNLRGLICSWSSTSPQPSLRFVLYTLSLASS